MSTTAIVSTDEIVGRLIRQIYEVAGPDAGVSILTGASSTTIHVHGIGADRYELHAVDDPLAPIRIYDSPVNGERVLKVQRTTLLRALQDAAAALAFPTTTGATLRLIDGGEPA